MRGKMEPLTANRMSLKLGFERRIMQPSLSSRSPLCAGACLRDWMPSIVEKLGAVQTMAMVEGAMAASEGGDSPILGGCSEGIIRATSGPDETSMTWYRKSTISWTFCPCKMDKMSIDFK